MLRRQKIAAWRPCGNKLLPCAAVGPNQVDALASAVFQRFKESGAVQEQVPGRDERRRNSVEEQEQIAPANSLELDFLRVRGVPGEGGGAGRPCKRGPSRSPGRLSWDEEGDEDVGGWVTSTNKERKTVWERTPEPLKKTDREGTQAPQKETARVRIREP